MDCILPNYEQLAEYHVVDEECKIILNNEGRRILKCIDTAPDKNDFGLLEPIHDAAKWLQAHSPQQHNQGSSINFYKQQATNKRN